jgi:hypothetical protein
MTTRPYVRIEGFVDVTIGLREARDGVVTCEDLGRQVVGISRVSVPLRVELVGLPVTDSTEAQDGLLNIIVSAHQSLAAALALALPHDGVIEDWAEGHYGEADTDVDTALDRQAEHIADLLMEVGDLDAARAQASRDRATAELRASKAEDLCALANARADNAEHEVTRLRDQLAEERDKQHERPEGPTREMFGVAVVLGDSGSNGRGVA